MICLGTIFWIPGQFPEPDSYSTNFYQRNKLQIVRKNSMPLLRCRRIQFYSEGDELTFFRWIKTIGAIKKHYGEGDIIYLKLESRRVSNSNLRELIALFYRYKIDMKQLIQFLNNNKSWFGQTPKAFWYKRVFKNWRAHSSGGQSN